MPITNDFIVIECLILSNLNGIEKRSIDELISICVQEEDKLSKERVEKAPLTKLHQLRKTVPLGSLDFVGGIIRMRVQIL